MATAQLTDNGTKTKEDKCCDGKGKDPYEEKSRAKEKHTGKEKQPVGVTKGNASRGNCPQSAEKGN